MKRRTFLKLPLVASVVASTDSLAERLAKSIKSTREVVAVNLPPRDPEMATKYISGLYRSKAFAFQKLVGRISTVRDIHGNEADNYTISGEGKTRDEAWVRFWMSFDTQIKTWATPQSYDKDIFWRREVSVETTSPHWRIAKDGDGSTFYVSCRFSLGDFT